MLHPLKNSASAGFARSLGLRVCIRTRTKYRFFCRRTPQADALLPRPRSKPLNSQRHRQRPQLPYCEKGLSRLPGLPALTSVHNALKADSNAEPGAALPLSPAGKFMRLNKGLHSPSQWAGPDRNASYEYATAGAEQGLLRLPVRARSIKAVM